MCLSSKYCRNISAIVFEIGDFVAIPFLRVGIAYLKM